MPCDLTIGATRKAVAIDRLKERLADMSAKVIVGKNGGVAFVGWTEKDGVSDICAYRNLMQTQSFELRTAIKRAETRAGRKIDPQAIAAGIHSHDGGQTWSKH